MPSGGSRLYLEGGMNIQLELGHALDLPEDLKGPKLFHSIGMVDGFANLFF